MIIVRLRGGLGNQLFQYALARKLAIERKTDFSFDITGYVTYPFHKYSLHPFAILERFATEKEIQVVRKPTLLKKVLPYYFRSSVEERHFHFDKNILKVPADVYLDGYWQSEKYFSGIEDLLLKEFQITIPPTDKNRQLAKDIQSVLAVSLHIRRGDYVSNPVSLAFHGVSSLEYYQQAIQRMNHLVEKPNYFVFSDDPVWVRANLSMPDGTVFVEHNGPEKNYEDFRLMCLCQYHIIANSTFSWWAAWMNQKSDKIVVAPKKWFKQTDTDTKDLFPKSWIIL